MDTGTVFSQHTMRINNEHSPVQQRRSAYRFNDDKQCTDRTLYIKGESEIKKGKNPLSQGVLTVKNSLSLFHDI